MFKGKGSAEVLASLMHSGAPSVHSLRESAAARHPLGQSAECGKGKGRKSRQDYRMNRRRVGKSSRESGVAGRESEKQKQLLILTRDS